MPATFTNEIEVQAIIEGTIAEVRKYYDPRIAALEAKVVALEARPLGLQYAGTWDAGKHYTRDVGVTCSGSLWICLTPNAGLRPGTAPAAWRLAVKKGSDGRDLT